MDGKFVEGKWILSDGSHFVGKFKYNKPTGDGKWVLANKDEVHGVYNQKIVNDPEDQEGRSKIELEWVAHWSIWYIRYT